MCGASRASTRTLRAAPGAAPAPATGAAAAWEAQPRGPKARKAREDRRRGLLIAARALLPSRGAGGQAQRASPGARARATGRLGRPRPEREAALEILRDARLREPRAFGRDEAGDVEAQERVDERGRHEAHPRARREGAEPA